MGEGLRLQAAGVGRAGRAGSTHPSTSPDTPGPPTLTLPPLKGDHLNFLGPLVQVPRGSSKWQRPQPRSTPPLFLPGDLETSDPETSDL